MLPFLDNVVNHHCATGNDFFFDVIDVIETLNFVHIGWNADGVGRLDGTSAASSRQWKSFDERHYHAANTQFAAE